MTAVFAPVTLGLATLWMPREWIERRMAVAVAGPLLSFILLIATAVNVGGHLGAGASDHHDDGHAKPQAAAVDHLTTGTLNWMPSLNINFAFLTDGLGLFFALLVSGVGVCVFLYARGYFGKAAPTSADDLYRFYPTIGFFTTAMLGVVLADYTLLTLLFWEMTSISSFLLIGWDRYDKKAVKLAMQAFFTTGLGGMGLFGGVLVFGNATGYWRWSEMLANNTAVIELIQSGDAQVMWAFVLMFIGAGTKSAQFPFHYWLPGAMAAPTPVSAFLHSATMVKAGVFLVGRLFPVFAALPLFPKLIIPFGAVTMLYGGVVALQQHDLKRIFAYTTVSQLGLLMAMYGLGALSFESHGHTYAAIDFDVTQIANHAFYKAPLFIAAGAIGHVLSRDITQLNGAFKKHPAICGTMMLAALGLAAVPGTISFQAKELFLYAIYHAAKVSPWLWLVMLMTIVTAVCNVAIATRVITTLMGWKGGMTQADAPPSDHHDDHHHEHHHEHGLLANLIWFPGAAIVSLQFLGGLFPGLFWGNLLGVFEQPATTGNYFEKVPNLWYVLTHVFESVPFWISMFCLVAGFFVGRSKIGRGAVKDFADHIYPAMYWLAVTGGGRCFRLVQTGNLKHYLLFVLGALTLGFGWSVAVDPAMWDVLRFTDGSESAKLFEYWPGLLLGLIVCLTAVLIPLTEVRIVRVVFLGACGFAVVALYLVYQAPDLALTQLMFEIISVILFVIVLRLLPREKPAKKGHGRAWRVPVALAIGLMFGWMTLVAASHNRGNANDTFDYATNPDAQPLGLTHAQHSYGLEKDAFGNPTMTTAMSDDVGTRGGGGNNIVNVILVDFRSFDTFGEITVLGLAAMGVWSMLPHRRRKGDPDCKVDSDYPQDAINPLDHNGEEVTA